MAFEEAHQVQEGHLLQETLFQEEIIAYEMLRECEDLPQQMQEVEALKLDALLHP